MNLLKEIEKCFPILISEFNKGEIIGFINCDYKELNINYPIMCLRIKNHILEKDSDIYAEFIKSNITSTNDMSNLIMSLFYAFLNSKLREHNDIKQ